MSTVKETPPIDHDAQIAELAKLPALDYDKVRQETSNNMSIRVTTLDDEVKKLRVSQTNDVTQQVVEDLEVWESSVDGSELLNIIEATLNRHVVLPKHCSTAIALWIMGSYCMDSWRVWSKLLITSPQKRCGKSVLMETLEGMVYRPLLTSNISASALFRSIEMWKPTLLIDEADTFTADNDELNGIINCGHTKRTARVIRSEKVGDSHEPKVFMVWSPQVIAGIGKQRGTLEDRSIQILMRRRSQGEKSEKLSVDYFENQTTLRRKLMRWSIDNSAVLSKLKVNIPACGNDRAEDNWRSLFVIAERVGDEWLEKVKEAYTHLTKTDDDEAGTMLLHDIKNIFESCDRVHSDDLVNKLIAMDDRPWSEWKRGFPLTKNSISKLLKPYQIKTKQLKINGVNRHGYEKSSFDDAFKRYLSPPPIDTTSGNATTLQPSCDKGCRGNQNATPKYSENQNATLKRPPDAGCSEVAFQKAGMDEGGVFKL